MTTAVEAYIKLHTVSSGKLKGIALNTSNYQKTDAMLKLCDKFAAAVGKKYELKCVIDTSRNYKGPTPKNQWCNAAGAGVGPPPTSKTGNPRAAYFLWVKPPGESDGQCKPDPESVAGGSTAGEFFPGQFTQLWSNSYFVEKNITSPAMAVKQESFDSIMGMLEFAQGVVKVAEDM